MVAVTSGGRVSGRRCGESRRWLQVWLGEGRQAGRQAALGEALARERDTLDAHTSITCHILPATRLVTCHPPPLQQTH